MSYNVIIKPKAKKALRKIPNSYIIQINKILHELEDNPRPFGVKKLSATEDCYRIRVGVYRIVYTIEDNILTVEVINIDHRKDVYK
jgi:mRNA interferase RelE/StbE